MIGKLVSAGLRTVLLPVAVASDVVRTVVESTGVIEPTEQSVTERQLDQIQDDLEDAAG